MQSFSHFQVILVETRLKAPVSILCHIRGVNNALGKPLLSSYLSKVPDVKKVKSLKEIAFLHGKYVTACRQECPDLLQAQELQREEGEHFRSEIINQSS